jgi:hypothetical protein
MAQARHLPEKSHLLDFFFLRVNTYWELVMKIFIGLFFLISLVGSAWAGAAAVAAPGPEMSAGVIGMTLAAGLVYLIKRRKRS